MQTAAQESRLSFIRRNKATLNGITISIELAEITLENARKGIGKEEWLVWNYIAPLNAEIEWQAHLERLEENVKNLRREAMKIKGWLIAERSRV